MSKWRCETCNTWFYKKPGKSHRLKACIWLGNYKGKPPFSKSTHNDKPWIAEFIYCKGCLK